MSEKEFSLDQLRAYYGIRKPEDPKERPCICCKKISLTTKERRMCIPCRCLAEPEYLPEYRILNK